VSNHIEAHLASLPPEAETRLAALITFVCQEAHTLADQMGGIDAFVAYEAKLYDTYVAPVDVPWVPDMLEPVLIDVPVKKVLEAITRRAYQRGAPLVPTPTPAPSPTPAPPAVV
jgi:hypothetical protein